jgi:pimeloyl-ACP methyl ester carboxylesterase
MPTLAANGLQVMYTVEGAGPPLVMLHGATSSGREDFAAQLPLFRRAFQCVVPDARGHAGTRWDAADGFSYQGLVDDLEAFADGLGLGSFHLLGFSMGAATALGFAIRRPERLRTLVVVGISPEREPRASVARRLFDPDRIDRHDPAWAAELERRHGPVQGEGAWRRLLPAIARDVASQALPGPGDLVRIDAPTLVVVGDRDPFVPVGHAWALRRQLPDARLFVAPDCGHEVGVRRPALFNEALAGFYRSTQAIAARRAEAWVAARTTTPIPPTAVRATRPTAGTWTSSLGDASGTADPDTDWLKEAAR